jgi:DNA polymerase sigma
VFGSFCSSLYHKGSDLDLTITGRWRNRHGELLDMVREQMPVKKKRFPVQLSSTAARHITVTQNVYSCVGLERDEHSVSKAAIEKCT